MGAITKPFNRCQFKKLFCFVDVLAPEGRNVYNAICLPTNALCTFGVDSRD